MRESMHLLLKAKPSLFVAASSCRRVWQQQGAASLRPRLEFVMAAARALALLAALATSPAAHGGPPRVASRRDAGEPLGNWLERECPEHPVLSRSRPSKD